MESRQVHL